MSGDPTIYGKDEALPPPSEPQAVARALLPTYGRPLKCWQGEFYEHIGTHWVPAAAGAVPAWVSLRTELAHYVANNAKGEPESRKWNPTIKKVAEVVAALARVVVYHDGPAESGLILANGVYENGRLLPHSPDRFNLSALPFDYDPAAEAREWLAFLASSLPGDETGHAFLQEWFGYVLSGRTDHQSMASLVGESRSGKGTIVRLLQAMLGEGSFTGVTLNDLAGEYGLSGLIGKTLATISEPKWASRAAGEVVEPLLRVTGNDTVRANRKYAQEWVGKLGTRFMILSNETPRLINRSGALANRMIHVRFPVSFAGREDIGLEDRLLRELPGILNWSLEGLKRLDAQGSFTVPQSHAAVNATFREYADPDAAFLAAKCALGPDFMVPEADLFAAYRAWVDAVGRTRDSTDSMTLRHRLAERSGLGSKRVGKSKVWHVTGLKISDEWSFPDDEDKEDNDLD